MNINNVVQLLEENTYIYLWKKLCLLLCNLFYLLTLALHLTASSTQLFLLLKGKVFWK